MATQQLTSSAPTFGGALVTVTGLYHYPIKSCAGTALTSATLDARGILHDRELMLVDATTSKFLTQRELPQMALITPRLADGELTVTAPGLAELTVPIVTQGATRPVGIWLDTCEAVDQGDTIAGWLSTFLGHDCRLVRMADDFTRIVDQTYATSATDQVGFVDGFPCLLIAEESLTDLNARLAEPLLMNRFRPNIVIAGGTPFGEDHLPCHQILRPLPDHHRRTGNWQDGQRAATDLRHLPPRQARCPLRPEPHPRHQRHDQCRRSG
jgi:uncharacterized protein YcbX